MKGIILNEIFDDMQKIYQVSLPLSNGETFEMEVINKNNDSISLTINDGAKFALRLPKSMKNLQIGDRAKMQYLEYSSAGKLYGRTKLLYKIKE